MSFMWLTDFLSDISDTTYRAYIVSFCEQKSLLFVSD